MMFNLYRKSLPPGEDKNVTKAKSFQHMSESIIIRTAVYLTGPRGGSFPVKKHYLPLKVN